MTNDELKSDRFIVRPYGPHFSTYRLSQRRYIAYQLTTGAAYGVLLLLLIVNTQLLPFSAWLFTGLEVVIAFAFTRLREHIAYGGVKIEEPAFQIRKNLTRVIWGVLGTAALAFSLYFTSIVVIGIGVGAHLNPQTFVAAIIFAICSAVILACSRQRIQ
jgi:hypothetical protein